MSSETKPLRIFVVDDHKDIADGLADVLRMHGHEVEVAYNGQQAIRIFREKEFDISFMDVMMPGMNGVESFMEIRKIRPAAKVIMMTGYSVEQLLDQAVQEGACGILHKPININDVLDAMDRIQSKGMVLIADDDPEFSGAIKDVLMHDGYKVCVARTGGEALKTVMSGGVDYLVLDLNMPVISGLEVYLQLQNRGYDIPTIIVTGQAKENAEALDAFRSLAVTGILTKPFDTGSLLQQLGAISDGQEGGDAAQEDDSEDLFLAKPDRSEDRPRFTIERTGYKPEASDADEALEADAQGLAEAPPVPPLEDDPETGPETGPEVGPEVGSEIASDAGPEFAPAAEAEMTPADEAPPFEAPDQDAAGFEPAEPEAAPMEVAAEPPEPFEAEMPILSEPLETAAPVMAPEAPAPEAPLPPMPAPEPAPVAAAPAAPVAAPAAPVAAATDAPAPDAPGPSQVGFKGHQRSGRILAVDDDVDLVEGIAEVLRATGYEVETAKNEQEAQDAIQSFDAQVALLDIRLGRTNGLDLIPFLKEHRPEIYCVVITGNADKESAITALRSGAFDYLTKPLALDKLFTVLDRCLGKFDMHQRLQAAFEELQDAKNTADQQTEDSASFFLRYSEELRQLVGDINSRMSAGDDAESVSEARARVGQLHELIECSNAYVQASSGRDAAKEQRLDICAVAETAVGEVKKLYGDLAPKIALSLPEEHPVVWGREQQLTDMLVNMLTQTRDLSNEDTELLLGLKKSEEGALLIVVKGANLDHDPNDMAMLLEPFGATDMAVKLKQDRRGNSMRLPLAMAFARAHDGSLRLHGGGGQPFVASVMLPAGRILQASGAEDQQAGVA